MVQSNLIERAKNGNPQAIAALMNQVLEPKGVTAKTQLAGNCLHIVFWSDHLLSQAAISNFVKNGLAPLGITSIQTVALSARKIGQDTPLWVERFFIHSAVAAQSAVTAKSVTTLPPIPSSAPASASGSISVSRPARPSPSASKATPRRSTVASQPQQAISSKAKPKQSAGRSQPRMTRFIHRVKQPLTRRYKVAIAITASAFLIGGTSAVFSAIQATRLSSATNTIANPSSPALANQSVVSNTAPANTPEGKVEAYLLGMNQAQRSFYQTQGKFAATLEELERSTSNLSSSNNYTYRLVVREQVQSVLTATPKQNQLKSYSGTVIVTDAASGSNLAELICKTHQPSRFPPIVPQATQQAVQCPAEAAPLIP